jgi:hypothetical protein
MLGSFLAVSHLSFPAPCRRWSPFVTPVTAPRGWQGRSGFSATHPQPLISCQRRVLDKRLPRGEPEGCAKVGGHFDRWKFEPSTEAVSRTTDV